MAQNIPVRTKWTPPPARVEGDRLLKARAAEQRVRNAAVQAEAQKERTKEILGQELGTKVEKLEDTVDRLIDNLPRIIPNGGGGGRKTVKYVLDRDYPHLENLANLPRLQFRNVAEATAASISASIMLVQTLSRTTDGDGLGRVYKRVVSQPAHPAYITIGGAYFESTAPRWFLAASAQSNGASAAYDWTPPPNLYLRNNEQTAFTAAAGTTQSAWGSFAAQKAFERPDMDVFAACAAVGGLDIGHWNNGLKNFKFDTDPTESDPGDGFLRVNNANPTLATELYCGVFSSTGVRKIGPLGTANAGKTIRIEKRNDPATFVQYTVVSHTFSPPGGGFYYNAQVTYHSSAGTIADEDNIRIKITPDMYETYLKPTLLDAISELGKQPDEVWWWQGESDVDAGFGYDEYIVDHDSLRAQMISDGLITPLTPWTIMGVAPESIYAAVGHDGLNRQLMRLCESHAHLYTYVHTGDLDTSYWADPKIHMTGAGYDAAGKLAHQARSYGRHKTRIPGYTKGGTQSEGVFLLDDTAKFIDLPRQSSGIGRINLPTAGFWVEFFWTTGPNYTPALAILRSGTSGSFFAATTGILTGTSATDGVVTISIGFNNKFYIQNRLGSPTQAFVQIDTPWSLI